MSDALIGEQFDSLMQDLADGRRWDLVLRSARLRLASLPDCPDAHRWAGWGALETGDVESASWHATQLQSHEPDEAWNFRLWAEIHFVHDRFDEARACLEEAIARWPDNPHYHQMLACVHAKRNDEPAAIASAEQALRLDPESVPARFTLNLFQYRCCSRPAQLEKQIAELKLLLRDSPNCSDILAQIGEIYLLRLNSADAAFPFLQQALANGPNNERIERLHYFASFRTVKPDYTFQNAALCAATATAMTSHFEAGAPAWAAVSITTGIADLASPDWIDTLATNVDGNSSPWTAEAVEELLIS